MFEYLHNSIWHYKIYIIAIILKKQDNSQEEKSVKMRSCHAVDCFLSRRRSGQITTAVQQPKIEKNRRRKNILYMYHSGGLYNTLQGLRPYKI